MLVFLEQKASPTAFERSQTGARCQKQEVAREKTVVSVVRILMDLGQLAFLGLHFKASLKVWDLYPLKINKYIELSVTPASILRAATAIAIYCLLERQLNLHSCFLC